MSNTRQTKSAKVREGNNRSFTLDAATEARIAYLVEFSREVLGVKTSGSGVVRRAVALLTERAEQVVRLKRGLELQDVLLTERGGMEYAMRGAAAPWKPSALEKASTKAGAFPTPEEMSDAHKTRQEIAEEVVAEAMGWGQQDRAESGAE